MAHTLEPEDETVRRIQGILSDVDAKWRRAKVARNEGDIAEYFRLLKNVAELLTSVKNDPSWRKVKDKDPEKDAQQEVERGTGLEEQGLLDEAITAYEMACAIAPWIPKYRVRLGKALRGKGSTARALDELRIAALLDPNNADAHYNLGVTLFALQDYASRQEAIAEFQKAIDIQPSCTDARKFLDIIREDEDLN